MAATTAVGATWAARAGAEVAAPSAVSSSSMHISAPNGSRSSSGGGAAMGASEDSPSPEMNHMVSLAISGSGLKTLMPWDRRNSDSHIHSSSPSSSTKHSADSGFASMPSKCTRSEGTPSTSVGLISSPGYAMRTCAFT